MTEKTEALAKPAEAAIARPARLGRGDTRGTEHLTKEDMKMPRLAMAQGLTPQVMEGKEGFAPGVLFNDMTEKIYGKGPIEFALVRADPPRWIQFRPMSEGGGVIDMNVPKGDPRTKWNGETPPEATMFYDYYIAMLPLQPDPMDSIICLSMKSTSLSTAKKLNSMMKLRNAAIWEGKYILTTKMDKNDKGIFAVYQVANAGWVDDDTSQILAMIYEGLKDRHIEINREPGDETDFPPVPEEGSSDM